MHEMALTESMVEIALEEARKADAARVQRIVLDVGALSAVAPEAMMFCFSAVSAGTAAEGAELVIERVEGAGWCPDCEKTGPLSERFDAMPVLRRLQGANNPGRRTENSRNGGRLMCAVCGCGQATVAGEKADAHVHRHEHIHDHGDGQGPHSHVHEHVHAHDHEHDEHDPDHEHAHG